MLYSCLQEYFFQIMLKFVFLKISLKEELLNYHTELWCELILLEFLQSDKYNCINILHIARRRRNINNKKLQWKWYSSNDFGNCRYKVCLHHCVSLNNNWKRSSKVERTEDLCSFPNTSYIFHVLCSFLSYFHEFLGTGSNTWNSIHASDSLSAICLLKKRQGFLE